MSKRVITINRMLGSNGRLIGRTLAEELGFAFYDKELIDIAAQKENIPFDILAKVDEKRGSNWRFPIDHELQMDSDFHFVPMNDVLFDLQRKIILEAAEKEDCVIVGRCANYILKDNPNVLSVFVHADEDFCLARAMERNSFSEKETKKFIECTDKYRSDYYRYHTGHHWTDARYYDLCLDSSKLGFENCALEIEEYAKIRFGK